MFIIAEFLCAQTIRLIPVLSCILNNKSFSNIERNQKINSPCYTDKTLARQIYCDFQEGRLREVYSPYIIWEDEEIHTETLNIDSNNNRKTCFSEKCSASNQIGKEKKKVFLFGGGYMLGYGVDDCNTIPSLLSQIISENNNPNFYCIVNFGASGYTSTQELIKLIVEIQNGNIPDVVIFYDGLNDIEIGAYRPGIPGYHMGYRRISNKFSNSGLGNVLFNSNIAKLYSYIHERFIRRDSGIDIFEINKKNAQLLNIYKKNIEILSALAFQYNFKYYAFWQPSLLASKKSKTAYEKLQPEFAGNFNEIQKNAYKIILEMDFSDLNFVNLNNIFDHNVNDIFIDYLYLGPKGNKLVAETIYETIKTDLIGSNEERN